MVAAVGLSQFSTGERYSVTIPQEVGAVRVIWDDKIHTPAGN